MYIVKMPEKWRIYGIFLKRTEEKTATFISEPVFTNSR